MYALTQSIKETVTPQPGTVPRPQKPLRSSSIRQEPLRFSRVLISMGNRSSNGPQIMHHSQIALYVCGMFPEFAIYLVLLCFGNDQFIPSRQDSFTGTRANMRIFQGQWSSLDNDGWMGHIKWQRTNDINTFKLITTKPRLYFMGYAVYVPIDVAQSLSIDYFYHVWAQL